MPVDIIDLRANFVALLPSFRDNPAPLAMVVGTNGFSVLHDSNQRDIPHNIVFLFDLITSIWETGPVTGSSAQRQQITQPDSELSSGQKPLPQMDPSC